MIMVSFLTGGGALIDGLDRVITRSVGIASYLVESPRYAVIKGVAKRLLMKCHNCAIHWMNYNKIFH